MPKDEKAKLPLGLVLAGKTLSEKCNMARGSLRFAHVGCWIALSDLLMLFVAFVVFG